MTRASYILFVLMLTGLVISLILYNQSKQRSAVFNARVSTIKEVLFLLERTEKLKNILRKTVFEGANQKDTVAAFNFSPKHKIQIDSILNRLNAIALYEEQRLRFDTIRQLIEHNARLSNGKQVGYYKGVSGIISSAQSFAQRQLNKEQILYQQQENALELWTKSIVGISLFLFALAIWSTIYENLGKNKLKALNASIKEREERFRLLATSIPQIIWIADVTGKIEYLSDQWQKYTGQSPSEGLTAFSSLIHEADIEMVRAKWKTSLQQNEPWQAEFRLKDIRSNTYTWFFGYTLPLTNDEGTVVKWIGSASDITAQKQLNEKLVSLVDKRTGELNSVNKILRQKNEELHSTQNFLQTVLDSSVELVSAFDTSLNYTFVNMRASDFVKKHPSELIGKNLLEVHPGIESTNVYEYLLKGLKGEQIRINSRNSFIDPRIIFETFFIPLKTDDKITGVLTLERDITPIVLLAEDLKKSNLDLKRSNDDLQQFAHVTSHDLKEPVRKIKIYGDLLTNSFDDLTTDKAKAYLKKVENATNRILSMIDGVLQYSSVDGFEQTRVPIQLNNVLEHILDDLEVVIREKNAVVTVGDLSEINGSVTLIYQLFYNLVNNALKFTRHGIEPKITINAEVVFRKDVGIDIDDSLGYQRFLKVEVSDNGIGFEQNDSEKIFQSFVRLNSKDKFEGTGLGLALTKKIVNSHGGVVKAIGRPGQGATFIVYLPLG